MLIFAGMYLHLVKSHKRSMNQERILQNLRFKRLFTSFKGVIDGFHKSCRPIIGVDKAHLKGCFGGVSLTTMGVDFIDYCVLLAEAVVESENNNRRVQSSMVSSPLYMTDAW